MAEGESKKKDTWDRADVIGKLLIPVAIAVATIWFDLSRKESEAQQKMLEVAIEVLQAPKSAETEQLRQWALGVFQKATGNASAELPSGAVQELQKGTQLPSVAQLSLPDPAQLLRVSIIRLTGTSADPSERIKSALVDGGYTNIAMSERSERFPDRAEVRFYYPADSQNALSLRNYVNNVLGIPIEVNDRSQDLGIGGHRPGDLNIYVR